MKAKFPVSTFQFRPAHNAQHCGQAIVEFVVALVGIIILLAGLIQIGLLTYAHTETMIAARHEAAEAAMADSYIGITDSQYIYDWFVGADGKHYTHDDVPLVPTNMPSYIQDIVATAHPDELSAFVPDNAFSRMQGSAFPVEELFLVRGYDSKIVVTFPIIRNLIYRRATISTESEAWLAWTEGIY